MRASPASEMANRAAASFYLSMRKDAAAEPFLKTAAAQPHQKLKSTLALADYYAAARRYQDARAVLEPLTSGPEAGAAKLRLAAIELESGSPETTRRLLDDADEGPADGRSAGAQRAAAGARRQTRRGDDVGAQRARSGSAASPPLTTWSGPSSSIAAISSRAERAFREVLRQNRLTQEASLQLARTLLAAGRPSEAVELAAAGGSSLDARLTLARALVADGQDARARAELVQLSADYPESPEPSIELGMLELRNGSASAGTCAGGRGRSRRRPSLSTRCCWPPGSRLRRTMR